jgi:hypothetical protein
MGSFSLFIIHPCETKTKKKLPLFPILSSLLLLLVCWGSSSIGVSFLISELFVSLNDFDQVAGAGLIGEVNAAFSLFDVPTLVSPDAGY